MSVFMISTLMILPTGRKSHLCRTWFWSVTPFSTPQTLRSLWTPRPFSAATQWTWSSHIVMRGESVHVRWHYIPKKLNRDQVGSASEATWHSRVPVITKASSIIVTDRHLVFSVDNTGSQTFFLLVQDHWAHGLWPRWPAESLCVWVLSCTGFWSSYQDSPQL